MSVLVVINLTSSKNLYCGSGSEIITWMRIRPTDIDNGQKVEEKKPVQHYIRLHEYFFQSL